MELHVPECAGGLLRTGNRPAKLAAAKKRKRRNKSPANPQQLTATGCTTLEAYSSKITGARGGSFKLQMLSSSFRIVFSDLLWVLVAILLLPVWQPAASQPAAVHPIHRGPPGFGDFESLANSSSGLSWTRDRRNEILRKLSSNGLLEALIKHPIQSNLPFPVLPTVTRRMPPPYSLNIQPQTSASSRLNQQQHKRSKTTPNHKLNTRPQLNSADTSLFIVEHLVEKLEENKKRLASASKLEPTESSRRKRPQQEQVNEPVLPSDLESLKHEGLTLNMLIREEYDLRVKPMLKSLLDQQRIATASSVQSSTSTTAARNTSLHNHRHEVSTSTNLVSTTLSPLDDQFGLHTSHIVFGDKGDAEPTTPVPNRPMTPSVPDLSDLIVTYENMEDRSDKISDVEFDDEKKREGALGRSRKRVRVTSYPKKIKIIPPYQYGLGPNDLFESERANVSTGSQSGANSSPAKSINGYKQQYRYPTTRMSTASEVSNADATTRLGSLVFSDGAHEAERVKNLRQRIHLMNRRPAERKKADPSPSPSSSYVDEDNEDEDEEDDQDGEGDSSRKKKFPNHLSSATTMSPLDKLELSLKQNSSTGDAVQRQKDRKHVTDQFKVASRPDGLRPMVGSRFPSTNYATTVANSPTITATTTTTTTPWPHTQPPALRPGNYFMKQPAATNGQALPSLRVPVDDSMVLQVTTPRYSFQLHEKPNKNATLYSIPNLSISEVINLKPRVREPEPTVSRKAAVSQENSIGALWSPTKISHQPDTSSETHQVQRKKHTAQQPANLLPARTANVSSSSSYPMLVSVVGTKGMVVSSENHSTRMPYSTPDYAGSGDTETEPTRTTARPTRILRGSSSMGDQYMESGHDLARRNESGGAIYPTGFQMAAGLERAPPPSSPAAPRGNHLTNLTDKHDPDRFWPSSLDVGDVSRRRPAANGTHRRPAAGTIEDAELSDYARADEDDADGDTQADDHHSPDHPMNGSSLAGSGGGRRRIVGARDRVSAPHPATTQQVVPASEFIRKFKPYRSKGFNPDSHEQAGSEIQMTEIDKALQQQQLDKKSPVPPLFRLPTRESSEVVQGGTLSSASPSSSSSSSPNDSHPAPGDETGASSGQQHSGKGPESRSELTTSATASAPVTKQQQATKQQHGHDAKGSPLAPKQSNDRLAFILIGGSCALSVVCLVLAAMSMRCQDMCDDYRSLRNAERAAMKLQKHRLKYTKSHQINRLSSGHERGPASVDDLQDNLSLSQALEAAELSAAAAARKGAAGGKCLAAGQHLSAQFGKSTANMSLWPMDCQAMNPTSSTADHKESQCRCANCNRWTCLDVAAAQHEKPAWQSQPSVHYCLHQASQHPARNRPLFGAGSSVGTFYPRRSDDQSAGGSAGAGFAEAQLLMDSQPAHSCSLSDGLRAAKLNNNSSLKAYQKQHVCADHFVPATCANADHGHAHLCHNHHANRYNMETSTSDGGKLTMDGSIHHNELAGVKCLHGASLSKRIKLMQLRSNLHSSHTSTGWKHSDALKAANYYQHHQHHNHHHHQHQHHQHQIHRHAKQQQQPSSSDSSSVDQCTCLHDSQPLLAKNYSRGAGAGAHKHLHQHQHQHAAASAKQEARYASHKTKRDKAMLVWSTNRDRLI